MPTRQQVATDDFNRADETLGSPNWQQVNTTDGTVSIFSQQVGGTGLGGNTIARYIGASFNADQYAVLKITSLPFLADGYRIGVAVRISSDTDSARDCYSFVVSADSGGPNYTTRLLKTVDGTVTTLASGSVAWSVGDTIELEAEGTTIRGMRNGSAVAGFTVTDSALTGGAPGIHGSGATSSNGPYGDDWEGGNLISALLEQEGFRFGADDGSESAHGWLAGQDVNVTHPLDTNLLLRLIANATGDPASAAYTLRYQKNGAGGYQVVPVGSGTAEQFAQPTFGAAGTGASGTTSCAPSYPTGINAATSKLLCIVTGRSNTADTAFTMPSGWTSLGQFEGGTGTWGVDTGTRRVGVFIKDTTVGDETGTVTVSLAGNTNNTLRATIIRIEVPAGYELQTQFASGADTTNDTSYSATASTSVTLDANRLVLLATAQNIDTGTATGRAISATGITFGTITNRADTAVTNGNDHRHIINTVPVTAGSNTVAPTFSYTISAAGSGPTAFLVMRARLAPVTNEIYIAPSANIPDGGVATTARLTPPNGKSGAQFQAGRLLDDANAWTGDLASDVWSELGFCLRAQSPATNGDYYELRVYAGSTPLDTYSVTPRWTIGTPAAEYPAGLRGEPAFFDPDLAVAIAASRDLDVLSDPPIVTRAAGDGSLVGVSSVAFAATGALTGTGALAGTSAAAFAATGALTGTGALLGASALTFAPVGALTGTGALAGVSALAFAGSGALTGTGTLVGTSALAFSASGNLTGASSGDMAGASAITFAASGALTGTGALIGASTLAFSGAGVLSGTGALAGTSASAFAAAGSLAGTGALAGVAAAAFTAAGALTGNGALAGAAAITLGASGDLTSAGSGAMTGAATVSVSSVGVLTGTGALAGTAAAAFSPAATLTGLGMLLANTELVFTGIGTLTNGSSSDLVGSSSSTFAAAGILTGVGRLEGAAVLAFAGAGVFEGTALMAGAAAMQIGAAGALISVARAPRGHGAKPRREYGSRPPQGEAAIDINRPPSVGGSRY